jgi:hypothetical protein
MESVWLLLGGSTPFDLIDPDLGFLGSSLFRYQTQGLSLLDLLGFPWILSCESRLLNGLHVINRQEIFHPAFLIETSVGTADPRFGMARNECSSGKLNAASDFLQEIAACPSRLADSIRRSGAEMGAAEGSEILPDAPGRHAAASASRGLARVTPMALRAGQNTAVRTITCS